MKTRIILADDHKLLREGVKALLSQQSGMEVVAEADDGRTTVHLVKKLSPDVVIMDISMPDLNGIEATRQILKSSPKVKVIALSMHSDKRFILEMLNAGASGYLLKDCALDELINAIHAVVSNRSFISPSIAEVIIKEKEYRHIVSKENLSVFSLLTVREREVLQFLAEGKTVKEIAYDLHLSVKTIETYRQNIMAKLDIHTIAGLTKYAIREGITSLNP